MNVGEVSESKCEPSSPDATVEMPPEQLAEAREYGRLVVDLVASAGLTARTVEATATREDFEAVARIKVVLQHEGLITTAQIRRPQLGVSDAEKKQLLESYEALKKNEFRAKSVTQAA